MKVRLEEGLQLIITPENYIEQVALNVWSRECLTPDSSLSGLLIESYYQAGKCHVCKGDTGAYLNGHWTDCIACSATGVEQQ